MKRIVEAFSGINRLTLNTLLKTLIVVSGLSLFCTPAHAQWDRVDGAFKNISVDDQYVWAVTDNMQIKRRAIDGTGTWENMTGTVRSASVSGDGWVWALQDRGRTWKCQKPCLAGQQSWSEVGGWPTPADPAIQVSGGKTFVWARTENGMVYRRPIDGSGAWTKSGGQVARLSGSATDLIWGTISSGAVYKCAKPCTGGANNWSYVDASPDLNDRLLDISATDTHVFAVGKGEATGNGSIWYRETADNSNWTKIPGGLTDIAASSKGFIWGRNSVGEIYVTSLDKIGATMPSSQAVVPTSPNVVVGDIIFLGDAAQKPPTTEPAPTAVKLTRWQPYGHGHADISVGEDFAWALTSSGEIKRIPIGGNYAVFPASPWTTIPGTLADIAASGSNWVWGVNSAGVMAKCAKPCSGRWSQVNNWPTPSDLPKQVSADENHVWVITRSQKIWQGPINGSGNWKLIPGGLSDISASGADAIWGVNNLGEVFECQKPCYGTPAHKWVPVQGLPSMTPEKIHANEKRLWIVDSDGNAWLKVGGGVWSKRASNVKEIASSNHRVWQVGTSGIAGKASLQEYAISPPTPYVRECRVGQINVDNECYKEVFFHSAASMDMEDAIGTANSLGGTLATREDIQNAWEHLGLDHWAYGRLNDGSYAVPVQRDQANFKRGVNFDATGGNQGIFYVKGCKLAWETFVKGKPCADGKIERNLASPLSEKDLNIVMAWIGERTSESTVDFCYRNTDDRPGYPWRSGDPAGDWNPSKARCELEHGPGSCEIDTLVSYPTCKPGMEGKGPICWQQCPTTAVVIQTGQNTKVDCGAACALNNDVCALAITDQVLAPINMISNIVTLGLSGAAQKAAAEAAKKGLEAGVDNALDVALSSQKWANLTKALEASEEIFGQVTGAQDKIQYMLDNVENLETEISRWNGTYEENFRDLTSWQVDNMINSQFNEQDASYIKQKYAQYQLTTILTHDKWRIAGVVTTVAGFEPTGIVSTIDAFAKPMCLSAPVPFPRVTVLPEDQRADPDPLVFINPEQ